jgi:hypothetical protein
MAGINYSKTLSISYPSPQVYQIVVNMWNMFYIPLFLVLSFLICNLANWKPCYLKLLKLLLPISSSYPKVDLGSAGAFGALSGENITNYEWTEVSEILGILELLGQLLAIPTWQLYRNRIFRVPSTFTAKNGVVQLFAKCRIRFNTRRIN